MSDPTETPLAPARVATEELLRTIKDLARVDDPFRLTEDLLSLRVFQSITAAEQRATLAERAAIVWLVSQKAALFDLSADTRSALEILAQAIERGDHLADSKGDET